MEKITSVFLLVLYFTNFGRATTLPPPQLVRDEIVFSRDLDPEFIICRQTSFPCDGIPECSTQVDYSRLELLGFPACPPGFGAPLAGECTLVNEGCTFSQALVASCVSWLPDCSTEYSCTTEAEYEARSNATCPVFLVPPPTPDQVCVPQDGECKRYNPCTIWQSHCNGDYNCGSQLEYGRFLNGPIPFCLPPDPNNPRPRPQPQGECLYSDGVCQWSACHSWLGHCRTSWNCGSEYDFQVFQSLPPPVCANPGPNFVPPEVPGVCQFNLTLGECDFGEAECEGGMEYTECGSLCPQTCERLFGTEEDLLLCPTVCVPGCFCRNDLVLHNGQCIQPSQCPNSNPCEPSPCEEDQECRMESVVCVRAPCPPVAVCIDRVTPIIETVGSSVVVRVNYAGARHIRVIVRDSNNERYTERKSGASVVLTFPNLPLGRARVRVNVRTEDRRKISSEWIVVSI